MASNNAASAFSNPHQPCTSVFVAACPCDKSAMTRRTVTVAKSQNFEQQGARKGHAEIERDRSAAALIRAVHGGRNKKKTLFGDKLITGVTVWCWC